MRKMLRTLVVALGVLGLTATGYADPLSGCGSCQGGVYLLQYDPTPVGSFAGGGKIYNVYLTIDTTNLAVPGAVGIGDVAIKISSSVSVANSSLVGAPGGVGSWNLQAGGISSAGCNGSGSGFLCATDPPPPAATLPHAGTYTWQFTYGTTGALKTGSLDSEIKVRYLNANMQKVGDLVSEGITLQSCTTDCGNDPPSIPEPSSVILLSSLVAVTGVLMRRRQTAR